MKCIYKERPSKTRHTFEDCDMHFILKHTTLEKQRGSRPASSAVLENNEFEELGKWMTNLQITYRLIPARNHEKIRDTIK